MNKYYVKNLPRTDLISVIRKLKEHDFDQIYVPTPKTIRDTQADFDILVIKNNKVYPLEVKHIRTSRGVYFVKKPGQHDNVVVLYGDNLYLIRDTYKDELLALHVQYKNHLFDVQYNIENKIDKQLLEEKAKEILEKTLVKFDENKLTTTQTKEYRDISNYKDFSYNRIRYALIEKTHRDNASLLNYNIIIKDEKLLERAKAYNPNPRPKHYTLLD